MLLGQYIKRNMPDAIELNDMISHPGEGYAIGQMEAAPVDTGTLRMRIKAYANGPDGPYLEGRLALYHQVHELFALLSVEPPNKGMKGYELKDSFIGGEEADLIMLTVSHEERSQEDIAYNVLLCSKNAVGERRARIRDGVRIGGMCVAEEFGYRGEFRSSVHPLALPLNLSEVYVLMDALAAYGRGCSRSDPHGRTARRIAGMIKRELSDYAKEKLDSRLKGMGFTQLEEVDPMFIPDVPGERMPGGGPSQVANWLLYEKAGRRVRVCLADGRSVEGIILPRAELERFFASRAKGAGDNVARKDVRPKCVIWRSDDDYDVIDWADVVDVKQG